MGPPGTSRPTPGPLRSVRRGGVGVLGNAQPFRWARGSATRNAAPSARPAHFGVLAAPPHVAHSLSTPPIPLLTPPVRPAAAGPRLACLPHPQQAGPARAPSPASPLPPPFPSQAPAHATSAPRSSASEAGASATPSTSGIGSSSSPPNGAFMAALILAASAPSPATSGSWILRERARRRGPAWSTPARACTERGQGAGPGAGRSGLQRDSRSGRGAVALCAAGPRPLQRAARCFCHCHPGCEPGGRTRRRRCGRPRARI
jgi:hypothetical protein